MYYIEKDRKTLYDLKIHFCWIFRAIIGAVKENQSHIKFRGWKDVSLEKKEKTIFQKNLEQMYVCHKQNLTL